MFNSIKTRNACEQAISFQFWKLCVECEPEKPRQFHQRVYSNQAKINTLWLQGTSLVAGDGNIKGQQGQGLSKSITDWLLDFLYYFMIK
jgi:hypothetical protein